MSKKDRQRQEQKPDQTIVAGVPVVADPSLPPGTAEMHGANGQTVRIDGIATEPTVLDATPAQIQHLEAELSKERARADDEYTRAERAMMERARIENDVAAIIEERDQMRVRASTLEAQSIALHSDLMVMEQTAAGRAPDIALQTELGKSAAHALSEVLTNLDKLNDQRLEGPALPLGGWASDTARQLVEAVPPHERVLLLGDLLVQLLPHTGEQGQNETASDVLKRLLDEMRSLETALDAERKGGDILLREHRAQAEKMVKIQSAMVARRAPDAEAGAIMTWVEHALRPALAIHWPTGKRPLAPEIIEKVVAEWKSLRAFFSEAPLTAVSVRDDGAKGPVRERYSLLVLTWDGKAVETRVVEGTRPWGDIRPYLEQTVRQNLVPGAYR